MKKKQIALIMGITLWLACDRKAPELQEVGEGEVIELIFKGGVPDGSVLRLDDLHLVFQANDTTIAVDNFFTYDPLAPTLLAGSAAVRVPCSINFRPGPEGWVREALPENLFPYHVALGFNQLIGALSLRDTYTLEGNAATAILGSSLRIRKRTGSMKVYKSPDLPIAVKTIE